jgi:hypothetical protein
VYVCVRVFTCGVSGGGMIASEGITHLVMALNFVRCTLCFYMCVRVCVRLVRVCTCLHVV